jgi:hypothetical protein
MVAEAANGGKSKLDLATAIFGRWKCSLSTAYSSITRAEQSKTIRLDKSDGLYRKF